VSQNRAIEPYEVALYSAAIKLAGATDTVFILARDMEDAVDQIRESYADMNVLFIESVERLSGTVYVSKNATKYLKKAL
jgi:hypothetical protein